MRKVMAAMELSSEPMAWFDKNEARPSGWNQAFAEFAREQGWPDPSKMSLAQFLAAGESDWDVLRKRLARDEGSALETRVEALCRRGSAWLIRAREAFEEGRGAWVMSFASAREKERASRLDWDNRLLTALARASQAAGQAEEKQAAERLLGAIMGLVESGYGFLGALEQREGQSGLELMAVKDDRWSLKEQQLAATRSGPSWMDEEGSLMMRALQEGRPIVVNGAEALRAVKTGRPKGHPPMDSALMMPIKDEQSKVVGLIGLGNRAAGFDQELIERLSPMEAVCAGLIKRRQAEKEARSIEARRQEAQREALMFKSVVDQIPQAVALADAGGGSIIYSNESFQALLKDRKDLEGEGALARVIDASSKLEWVGQALTRAASGIEWRGQVSLGGKPCWAGLKPLMAEGRKLNALVASDISESLEQTKKIETMAMVAERTRGLMAILGADGRVEWMNRSMEAFIDSLDEEPKGKPIWRLIRMEASSLEALKRARAAIDQQESWMEEVSLRDPSSKSCWAQLELTPIGEGRWLLAAQITTQRKKLEETLASRAQLLERAVALLSRTDLSLHERMEKALDLGREGLKAKTALAGAMEEEQLWRCAMSRPEIEKTGELVEAASPKVGDKARWPAPAGSFEQGDRPAWTRSEEAHRLPWGASWALRVRMVAPDGETLGELAFLGDQERAEPDEWEMALARLLSKAVTSEMQRDMETADLEQTVRARTQLLEEALRREKLARGELVRQARLSALGELIAGVAHDLSTPVGNARLLGAAIAEAGLELQGMLLSGGVKRAALETAASKAREAGELIDQQLGKAAELLSSFKQLSLGQTRRRRERFEVAEQIEELKAALEPTWRKTPFQLEMSADKGIGMDSFPGDLSRAIMGLADRALRVAFAGRSEGTLTIKAEARGSALSVIVEDDGAESAGSGADQAEGVGLWVANELIKEGLGGELRWSPKEGGGNRWELKAPLRAPRQSEPSEGTRDAGPLKA